MNALKRDAERKNLQQQTVDPNATYGEKIIQTAQNVREQIKYDQDIYGEGLSDRQVRQINKIVSEYVSRGDTLEDMQSRSYRMAQAMMYSNKLGISIQDAMEQLDSMNLATLGEAYNQNDDVGNFNALKNSFMLGINQIIGAHYGNMMSIHAAMGNQSGYDDYLLKLESLQRENQALSDPFKRNIAMEALKYGAQSAPFSFGTQLLSFIPEIGPAAAFGASMWNSYGSLYADFRQKGAGHAESLGVATVAAGLDAFIEVALGELAVNGAGELGETVFKKLTGKSREELVNKLTTEVFKRVKYNGALDNLLKESTKFVGSSIEEGIEEVLQYWNDELADATVAAISEDYDLEKLGGAERTKKIIKESAENFKGGFLGALTMGIPMQTGAHILNKAVLTSSINEARDVLSTVDSKVEAEKRLFNNPLFKGETDADTLENIDRHFDQYQFMRDQNYTKQAEELAELTQPAEGFAEAELDENGEPIATDAYRNAGGMLHVQDDVRENENGVTEGTYKVGNPSKKTKNLDGYIDYTLDEKNHTVEINKFIMSNTREDIRAEFFDRFAKDFAGYEIKWDPEGQRAIDLKNSLIKANPNGKNNGLSYYTDETTVADMQTRKNIAKQIKAAMPNLSNSQIAADVALLETVYKSLKKDNGYTSFTDYYQKTFGENIFGDKSVLEKSSIEQNGGKGVRGGVAFNQTEKSLRAVIYASEKADFSTWSHEIAHIFRQQLQGDLLREAETAFGVENGQWTRQKEEAFAEGFEKFLHTGQAQNNKLKNLFTKLAEFMARVYGALKGYVKFNPEVENVYNQLLKEGDDSILAQAEKAVRENDKLIREEERQYAEEQKKAQSEVKAQEDFEKSETNYIEQEQEETVEDKDLDKEIQDMSITAEDGSIDKNKFKDFVDRVKAQAEQAMLADVEKRKQTIMENFEGIDQNIAEEIADIITDPNSTAEDKQRAATLAGGLKKLEQIDLFQTMNYETVRYIANERVKGEIAFSLKQALELKNKGYSESAIASQTSWRYNNGDWTYEFDDNGMQVNFSTIRDTLKEMKESELDYFNGYGKVTLAQVMQHDKLYELFPEMKDIKVEFTSSNSRVKSLYDPKRNAIILNLKNRDLRMSLAAACQRYIQNLTQDITPSLELTADLNAEYQKVMAKYAWEKINDLDHKIDAIGVTQATKEYLADRLNQEVLNTANRWRMDHATRSFNKSGRADDSKKMYFQSEKDMIRMQYEGTAQWLKAPNGKTTNLTEDQWLTVRTPNFKNWFGDWEKDPQNASKVVDNNGEPRVVFHGTYNGDFDVFDRSKASTESDMGAGFYFTSNEDDVERNYEGGGPDFENKVERLAERIADEEEIDYDEAKEKAREQLYVDSNLYDVFLDMKYPCYTNETDIVEGLKENLELNMDDFENEEDYYDKLYAALEDTLVELKDAITSTGWYGAEDAAEKVMEFFSNENGTLQDLKDFINDGTIEVNDDNGNYANNEIARIVADTLGYDGIIDSSVSDKFKNMNLDDDTTHFIMFKNTSIKSATDNNGEFSRENPSILYQGDYETIINQTMTMDRCKDMIQRTFNVANIKNLYDGKYSNGDEWLENKGVDEVAMYAENEYTIMEKFINPLIVKIPEMYNGEIFVADIIEAYKNKTLTGKVQSRENNKIDLSTSYGITDRRFYAPNLIDTDSKKLLEIASQRVTKTNRTEVNRARADFVTKAHELGFADSIGMTQAAINAKLKQWANYPKQVLETSKRVNKDVALENQWTGLLNSNLIKAWTIEESDLRNMVKDIKGDSSEYQRNYIVSTMLALDTHIDYSELTYEFNTGKLNENDTVNGNYIPSENVIHIRRDGQNTVAHETGHYIDHKWGEEILKRKDFLTANRHILGKELDQDTKTWLEHFFNLLEDIENVSDIHSEYTMASSEVFARFVARFVEWTRMLATNGRYQFESKWYTDKFTTKQYLDFIKVLQEKSALDIKKKVSENHNILFQPAYHGSAANFDKFNTDEYGFSGEGSMSFGYGTYVSASEAIARDYAERQKDKVLDLRWYPMNHVKKYMENGMTFEEAKLKEIEQLKEYSNNYSNPFKKADYENQIKLLETVTQEELFSNKAGNLYTVDIPDSGYIKWDEDVDPKLAKIVKDAVFNKLTTEPNEDGDFEYKGVEKELQRELNDVFDNEMTGQQLYNNVAFYISGERNASKLLNKLGISGIDYPAGTNFGTPDGKEARNYVIFNDDDAKIIDHFLFQTEQNLYDDARMFDNWQDFMEFYEYGFGKPSPSLVPEDPDAAWYQTTWEMAHNIKPESQENEEIVQSMVNEDKNNEDPAEAKDALFTTKLQRPGELENFLSRIYDLRNMSEDMWTNVESEEDANERDKYTELQDYVKTYLNHGSLISNMSAVAQGKDLKESERQKIINLMSNNARNYREAYSKIMEDESLAVDITKEPGYRLSDPENNFVRKSFEERKRISEQVRNEDLAKEIRDGSLQMNDKLDKYIEYCDKQIKAAESEKRKAEQKLKDLNMEVRGDYQRIADWETRRLLELHDQLLMAKTKLKNHSDEVARRLDRGIKLTGKYDKTSQNLKANYDEIFRKFEDLRKTIEISEQVKAALKEREKYVEFRDKANKNQNEKKLIEKAKKMRIQLVKRAMRRVPFQKINYDQARTLIAIQRTLEPNLLGGVNKWIGQDQAYLRGVISSWITDEVERKKLEEYLKTKGTKTAMYVLDKLQETKTIEDFNAWTKQDRSKAHRVLPKENWIRELNLEQLAEEREKSIQLDITTRDETRTVTGKDGKTQVLTLTRVEMSPELEQTIKEALGDKLFNQVMAIPFNEWTTEEMEELAKRIDDIYIEGRNILAAKKQIRLEEAKAIRDAIESRLRDPGIYINEGDDDETKKRKQAKINKILGKNTNFKGTTEGNKTLSLLDKFAYGDANVLRVARILDNYDEAENVMELYRKEDQCYNDKVRAINIRNKNIERVMKENNITVEELTDYYKLGNHKFTVDELLFFIAADADHEIDPTKKKQEINDPYNLAQNDDYAPTSRNAVMFGTMFSSSDDLDFKEECRKEDEEMQKRLENNELTADEKNLNTLGILVKKPGTLKYLNACKSRYTQVLNLAYSLDEKYLKLLEAINKDYADQYERMNKASIEYFNIPVNRVKAYVPLVRLESNGDTNENRVMEDLLGSQGIGKQWVDKGMTKSRVNISPLNQKPVETGLYKTWNSSVERTEHFIAYSPYVQELNRVYKSRDAQYLRGYMENRYGKGMVKYIDNYINEVANPNQIAARNSLDNIVRLMRGKTAPAYLAWKTSSIIKQAVTSPLPFLPFVSPDKYIKACFDIIASKGKLYDEIKAISPYMNNRVMDPMIDLIEENIDKAKNPITYGINKFGKMGMQGLEWIDWICVCPGWLACYRDKYAELKKDNQFKYDQLVAELTEQNDNLDIISPERMTTEQIKQKADNMTMTESDIKDKAREYADDCTRKCQPSNRAVDLAPIYKAKGPGSEVGKALLQFQTSLNVIWQNIRYDLQYDVKQMGKPEIPMAVKKKIFSQICGIIFAYVFAGIMMNAVTDTPDEDDDKKDKVRKYMWYATTQFTDSVPVFGQALTSLSEQLITGKKSYESANDLFPMFTKFKNGIKFASGGNWSKAVSNFAEGLAMNFGLPTSGAKELLYAAGIGDKDGKLKFKPDAFIGRRRKEKK